MQTLVPSCLTKMMDWHQCCKDTSLSRNSLWRSKLKDKLIITTIQFHDALWCSKNLIVTTCSNWSRHYSWCSSHVDKRKHQDFSIFLSVTKVESSIWRSSKLPGKVRTRFWLTPPTPHPPKLRHLASVLEIFYVTLFHPVASRHLYLWLPLQTNISPWPARSTA